MEDEHKYHRMWKQETVAKPLPHIAKQQQLNYTSRFPFAIGTIVSKQRQVLMGASEWDDFLVGSHFAWD